MNPKAKSADQPLIQVQPPVQPPQVVQCGSCGHIMTVSPSVATVFPCPNCKLPQSLPSNSNLNPNPNHQVSLLAFSDPTKMQVICALCLAIVHVPSSINRGRFSCPLCSVYLAFDFDISSTKFQFLPCSPVAQQPNKVFEDNGVKNSAVLTPFVNEQTPENKIVALNDKKRVREVEETEECFVLDSNPSKDVSFSTLTELSGKDDDDSDISIVDEKGQVACRDYPHQRHLCVKYPFNETDHDLHCKMCYCYLCDVPAPCEEWTVGPIFFRHCDATAATLLWRLNKKRRCNNRVLKH